MHLKRLLLKHTAREHSDFKRLSKELDLLWCEARANKLTGAMMKSKMEELYIKYTAPSASNERLLPPGQLAQAVSFEVGKAIGRALASGPDGIRQLDFSTVTSRCKAGSVISSDLCKQGCILTMLRHSFYHLLRREGEGERRIPRGT